jgi:hypothetical protein
MRGRRICASEEVAFARRLKRQRRFGVPRESVTTSGRKLRAHTARAMIRICLKLARGGAASLRTRGGLEFWSGPRTEDGQSGG